MNNTNLVIKEFDKQIKNKFNVYNSLFLNLPYPNINNIGILIPLLYNVCKAGLQSGKDPLETLDSFFDMHTNLKSEQEKIDFMFRIVQYVERQIVLYDSVEDAAFKEISKLKTNLSLKENMHLFNENKVYENLSSFSTRIVFTAHPTQFYPPSVLNIIAKLRLLITNNDINEIDTSLRQLGLTSFINSTKPTPFEEAKNIIYFLRNVYYNAASELYSNIKKNLKSNNFDNPNILQFGFWPGGDRDGNPFVTSKTTMDVADELRMTLMKCYYNDIKILQKKLTFRKVEELVSNLRTKLYETMFNPNITISFEEIINPLYLIKQSLINDYTSLYIEELDNLIDKVKIFRTHFAILDIRQNHSIHEQVVEAILTKEKVIQNSLKELKKEELISTLIYKEIKVNANDFTEEIIKDTIENIAQIKLIQNK